MQYDNVVLSAIIIKHVTIYVLMWSFLYASGYGILSEGQASKIRTNELFGCRDKMLDGSGPE